MKIDQLILSRTVLKDLVRGVVVPLALVVFVLSCLPRAMAAEEEIPEPITETVADALIAWARFATTGDVGTVETVFVVDGPQHLQFQYESATRRASDTSDPLRFTVQELRLRNLGADTATVWASVDATRVGFQSQAVAWDFDLVRQDGRWKIWTVLPAERPPAGIDTTEPAPEPPMVATTLPQPNPDATQSVTIEDPVASPPESDSPAQPSSGVRLPALSAWIIVITVVGVALAGYLAPRLDRKAER